MVRFENLHKSFWTPDGPKVVASGITGVFPTGVSVALLGRNGAGKSSLMEMIGGALKPDKGTIEIKGTMSWPVGFAGSFHRDLTGAQNTKFIARVYGVDTDELLEFVEDFAELGAHFHLPVRNYSSGMKSRLAFGISIGIPFDTYLVDEVTAVGDASFKRKSDPLHEPSAPAVYRGRCPRRRLADLLRRRGRRDRPSPCQLRVKRGLSALV